MTSPLVSRASRVARLEERTNAVNWRNYQHAPMELWPDEILWSRLLEGSGLPHDTPMPPNTPEGDEAIRRLFPDISTKEKLK